MKNLGFKSCKTKIKSNIVGQKNVGQVYFLAQKKVDYGSANIKQVKEKSQYRNFK